VTVEFAQPEFPDGGRNLLRHPLLADMAIHHADLLRWLTGEEATVVAARPFRGANIGYAGGSDVTCLLALLSGATVTYSATWASDYAPTPWDGNWTFRGADGLVTVRDTVVTVDCGDGPVVTWSGADAEHEDLIRVWQDFMSVLDGRQPAYDAAVSVSEHARSLDLVFEMSAAAGVDAPHLQTAEK
jgi:predicted dehydrogenase